jgi:type VI secretion system protein ImpH
MAIASGQQRTSVAEDLFQNSYQYEFHQAIKILQILNPALERIGQGVVAQKEIATLKTHITFSPPPSDIYNLQPARSHKESALMTINFMGIAGHSGPLPDAYSEILIDRLRSHDHAFADFLDIFNHRLVSVSHRIHVKYNYTLELVKPHHTQVAHMLFAIGGITHPEAFEHSLVPARSYLKYIGYLWQQPQSVTGLRIVLSDYFNLDINIEEFIGQWLYLDDTQTTTLGTLGQMNILGNTAAIGDRAWTCTEKIRIHIGGLALKKYAELFPGGALNKKISLFVHEYMGDQCHFDLSVELNQRDIPYTKLDGTAHLGWTSWLKDEKRKPEVVWVTLPADLTPNLN